MSTTGQQPEDRTEGELWQLWSSDRSLAIRTRLFFFYGQWLRMLIGLLYSRYPHPLAQWGDYMSLGSIGLLQAIDRFKPDLNSRFKSYAEPYIKGNILKGLACYVKDRKRFYQERLASLLGESGGRGEEADLEQVANVAIGLAFGLFLESGVVDHEPADNNPLSLYETERDGELLDQCVKLLSANERQVIEGHYYQHLSFVEVSELMGISRSRVSQLHAQALKNIRATHERLMQVQSW